ncbi:hypothetical protein [Persicobacter sp. CCB-QB2]|uniref:hypothetical protein n=1 Tax=Persicobacter sp. CCB-QB2 TaxID=1561025 RepID=UPI0006AA00AE|nr:hypothetical protein [Persicobacter sp. CCB-QB2]
MSQVHLLTLKNTTKKAIYVGACGLAAYYLARHLKKDASAFLFVGGLLGEILAENTVVQNN